MPFSTCIIPFQNMLYIIMSKIKQTKRENTKSVNFIIVSKYLSTQTHRYSIRQSQAFHTLEYECTGNILFLADGVETSPVLSHTHTHTHSHTHTHGRMKHAESFLKSEEIQFRTLQTLTDNMCVSESYCSTWFGHTSSMDSHSFTTEEKSWI